MNLKEFLEEEHIKFIGATFSSSETLYEWFKKHDTRLINFVLDEVKREVEKLYDIKQFSDLQPEFNRGHKRGLDDTLDIIDQLKLK